MKAEVGVYLEVHKGSGAFFNDLVSLLDCGAVFTFKFLDRDVKSLLHKLKSCGTMISVLLQIPVNKAHGVQFPNSFA